MRSGLLGSFDMNALLRGGDAVRVESLSAQSDYQKRKVAHTHRKREQAEREKMQMRFRSRAETRLRVVPIQGDGRCLFRALVSICCVAPVFSGKLPCINKHSQMCTHASAW